MYIRHKLLTTAIIAAALSLTGCGAGPSAPPISGLTSQGAIVPSAGLAPNSIAIAGSYAYLTLQGSIVPVPAPGAIAVLNISATVPTLLTTFPMPCSMPNGIRIAGAYAYVACFDTDALYVLRIGNAFPFTPTLAIAGSVAGIPSPYPGIALSGSHVYLPSHAGFVYRVDVSNPAAPVIDGSVATAAGTSPNGVYVSGNVVYCACSSEPTQSYFQTFTATGPMTPLGQIPLAHSPQRVVVGGNYAYVTNFDASQLDIIDVTNPALPALLSTVALPCYALPIAVTANYAYVGCYTAQGIATIDITHPATPAILGYTTTSANPVQDIVLNGTGLYAISGDTGGSFNTLAIH